MTQPLTNTRKRCPAVSDLTAAKVGNLDGTLPIERQLSGTSTVKIFLLPESCHPEAPAFGRQVKINFSAFRNFGTAHYLSMPNAQWTLSYLLFSGFRY
jgi:hypothetical protein